MPSNPHGCCELDIDCCDVRMPEVLTATFTNDGGCPKVDGVSVTLIWNGGSWEAFEEKCGAEGIEAELICPATIGCETFTFGFSLGCGVGETILNAESGCSCDPVNLVFKSGIMTADKFCDCCDPLADVQVTITITE